MQFLFSCIDLVKNSVSLYTHEFFLFLNSSFSSSVFRFHYLQYPFSSLLNTAPFFVMLFMPLMYLSSVSDIPDLGLGMYSWSNSVESQRAFFFILGFYLDSLFADSVHAHYYLDPSLLRGNLLFNSWTSENASIDLGAILRSSSTDNSGIGMHVPTFQALLSTGAILNPSLVPFSIEYTSIHSFFDSWGLSGSISLFPFGQHVQSGNTETVGLDSFFASEYLYPIVTDGRYEWTHCIPWTGTPPDFGYRYIDYIRLIDGRPILYNGRVQYETQPGILELDLFYGYLDNREAFTLYGVNPLYQEIDFIGVIPAWYENANLNLSGAYLFMDKNYLFTSADAATAWQMNFQDPATPVMEGLINLHHDLVFFLVLVITFVFWMLSRTVWHFHHTKNPIPSKTIHLAILEIVWTTIPALILVVIAIPSFSLLYATDEVIDPAITIKAVGHQWYWSYEYTDYETKSGSPINFDSVMVLEDDLEVGQLRLLEVDNRIVLPANTHIRIVVTAADVLHSWCVPSLGVKLDACPGRLNEVPIFIKREGVYYGQCSEICGVNHGFMPIVVQAVSYDDYLVWLSNHDV